MDLAGSERLGSGASATDRLKETQSINKSLSNLGNVIMALANKVNLKCLAGIEFCNRYMYIQFTSVCVRNTTYSTCTCIYILH